MDISWAARPAPSSIPPALVDPLGKSPEAAQALCMFAWLQSLLEVHVFSLWGLGCMEGAPQPEISAPTLHSSYYLSQGSFGLDLCT